MLINFFIIIKQFKLNCMLLFIIIKLCLTDYLFAYYKNWTKPRLTLPCACLGNDRDRLKTIQMSSDIIKRQELDSQLITYLTSASRGNESMSPLSFNPCFLDDCERLLPQDSSSPQREVQPWPIIKGAQRNTVPHFQLQNSPFINGFKLRFVARGPGS